LEDLLLYVRGYTEDDGGCPSNATQRKRYRHVRAWLNWCVEEGLIDRSPLDDLTQPKEEKKEAAFLKPKDVDRLLVAIENHMETTTDAVGRVPDLAWLADVIRLAVATGLRRGELVALRWEDVDLDDRRMHVRHRNGFTTKNSRERRVPIRGGALEVLRRMDAERDVALDGPVFTDRGGLPIKPDRMTKAFKRMARKAGLDERIHFHSLRHTTGSWLAMKGVPIRVIQAILGHSSVNVTERYSHLAPETLDAAMEETFGDKR
jgi:integrase